MEHRNIYEQEEHNKRATFIVMFVFICFLGLIGLGFDAFYLGTINDQVFLPTTS